MPPVACHAWLHMLALTVSGSISPWIPGIHFISHMFFIFSRMHGFSFIFHLLHLHRTPTIAVTQVSVGCSAMSSSTMALDDPVSFRALLVECQMPSIQIEHIVIMRATQRWHCLLMASTMNQRWRSSWSIWCLMENHVRHFLPSRQPFKVS